MNSPAIRVEPQNDRIVVVSPYNSDFVAGARQLGGRFSPASRTWSFDIRDERRVRELCLETYGTDGEAADQVTVRVDLDARFGRTTRHGSTLGRTVARVFGRKIGSGVVVIEGKFDSAGSRKNPDVYWIKGTVVLMRGVPRKAVEAAIAAGAEGVTIVDEAAGAIESRAS